MFPQREDGLIVEKSVTVVDLSRRESAESDCLFGAKEDFRRAQTDQFILESARISEFREPEQTSRMIGVGQPESFTLSENGGQI
jgi:hypothetical protein